MARKKKAQAAIAEDSPMPEILASGTVGPGEVLPEDLAWAADVLAKRRARISGDELAGQLRQERKARRFAEKGY